MHFFIDYFLIYCLGNMSFYVFLLVTSLVCFSQARPPVAQESGEPVSNPPVENNPAPAPNSNSSAPTSSSESDEQMKIDELLTQVRSALDVYITPFMVNVTKEDQDILTNLGVEEFSGSVNYILYIIQELNDPSYNGGAIDRSANDFIVELDSFDPFPDVPFIEQNDMSSE